jgi:hypothetical protein
MNLSEMNKDRDFPSVKYESTVSQENDKMTTVSLA